MAAAGYGHAPDTLCPLTHSQVSPDSPIPPWSSHILHCLHKPGPSIPRVQDTYAHWQAPALWLMPAESLPL